MPTRVQNGLESSYLPKNRNWDIGKNGVTAIQLTHGKKKDTHECTLITWYKWHACIDNYFRTQHDVFTPKSYDDLQLEVLKETGFFDKIKEHKKKKDHEPCIHES